MQDRGWPKLHQSLLAKAVAKLANPPLDRATACSAWQSCFAEVMPPALRPTKSAAIMATQGALHRRGVSERHQRLPQVEPTATTPGSSINLRVRIDSKKGCKRIAPVWCKVLHLQGRGHWMCWRGAQGYCEVAATPCSLQGLACASDAEYNL